MRMIFSSEKGAGLITAIMVIAVGTLVLFGIQKNFQCI